MDPEIAKAIHSLNAQSHDLNQHIVQKSATMQEIPMDQTVYQEAEKARQRIAERRNPQQVTQQVQQPVPQPIPQPVQQVVQQDLTPLIDRITAVEKQVTKFVNLIERNVAKNAKEINIRIKLNENNDSTDSK